MRDLWALALSGGFVGTLLALAEWLRRGRGVSVESTRKLLHVGIGSWVVPTILLFERAAWAAAGPAVFIALNFAGRRGRWFRAIEDAPGPNRGAIYMPVAFAVLILGFWDRPGGRGTIAAALLALAWGDAAAALVGKRFGRRRYAVGDEVRTVEGSVAMFAFSCLAVWVGSAAGGDPAEPLLVLGAALIATLIEAISVRGLDNFFVPVGTALFLAWFGHQR